MLSNGTSVKISLPQNGLALTHYAITEYYSPRYQGTMMLKKLPPLVDAPRKIEKQQES